MEESTYVDNEDSIGIDASSFPETLALVTRRVLHIQETPPRDQRENIFHTRYTVKEQSLSVIIDGGSCCNLINAKVVEFLHLKTSPKATCYGLNGITDGKSDNLVTRQCLVHFNIGPYIDSVWCDVAAMDCSHILLGRP